jgi:hypothetical protein
LATISKIMWNTGTVLGSTDARKSRGIGLFVT